MNIVGKRYWFLLLSFLVIIPGMLALALWGLPLAIDFTGGSLLEVRFAHQAPQPAEVIALYTDLGIGDPVVQTSVDNSVIVRSKPIDEAKANQVVAEMEKRFNDQVEVRRFIHVGPSVGKEVATRAAGAVALSALAILLYLTYAFRGVPNAFRYGVAAILAMLHDVAVTLGVEAMLGHFLGWEADAMFLTALLTVIGFSVHDSIVVFDRIRENSRIYRGLEYETLVNHSIVQTLDRSINTQLTVMLTLLALALFGGVTIRHFVIILLVGIFSGTYSSILNAAPILVIWENREWRTWFRRKPGEAAA
ncbi:MAG TPA: protein translocase subunit SecF [Anaerolineae bacterium]|nr:protein translocase subunit SecF [Anaerolineae bacterium]HID84856.1 protein translocase subunit SecF [Anaerolineales bacterium]HIQ09792.1 protein translocase subunit SecF [Anaerolineaceae bacterium]